VLLYPKNRTANIKINFAPDRDLPGVSSFGGS
jgi:hypothetical protein